MSKKTPEERIESIEEKVREMFNIKDEDDNDKWVYAILITFLIIFIAIVVLTIRLLWFL